MINNGNNGGGNPNHAQDGKFTSGPNQAGQGGDYESKIKEKLGISSNSKTPKTDMVRNKIKQIYASKGMSEEEIEKMDFMNVDFDSMSNEEIEQYMSSLDSGDDDETPENYSQMNEFSGPEGSDKSYAQIEAEEFKIKSNLKKLEDTYPHEIIYDYDEDGNRNGYEVKFKNPEIQKQYDELYNKWSNLYSQQDNNDKEYEEKLQKQLGIQNPEGEPSWKKAGYDEPVTDMDVVKVDRENPQTGEVYSEDVEVDSDMVQAYLESAGIQLTDEEKELIKDNMVIPTRFLQDLGFKNEEEMLKDFGEFVDQEYVKKN